ncbi:hypothetical protein BH24ACT1_BH24ACT1_06650 [soil metagenome]
MKAGIRSVSDIEFLFLTVGWGRLPPRPTAPGGPIASLPVQILLVRHAQSEWNAIGRWQGWADPPLSELGRQQSRLAAKGLHDIDVAVSSDLQRAIDTATLMVEPLGLAPAKVEPRLRERDVGEWTGLTRDEINQRWPEALSTMADPPGGESALTLQTRMVAAVTSLARTYPHASVLAVTHGGAIRSLERHLGVDPHPLPNLGGTWLEVFSDTMAVGPRVLLVDPDEVAVTVPRQL